MQIIVAFSSRNDSIAFCDLLRKKGYPSTLINTPRELSVGCGLAVSIEGRHLELNYQSIVIFTSRYRSYLGAFSVNKVGGKLSVTKINS